MATRKVRALRGMMAVAIVASGAAVIAASVTPVGAHDAVNDQLIPGGGNAATDCMVQFFGGELNYPAPPKPSKKWLCIDGDQLCDYGPAGDGACDFAIGLCVNGSGHSECQPSDVASVLVKNKPLDSPKYDTGLADLQTSVDALGLPNAQLDLCTPDTATIRVPLKATGAAGKKTIKLKSTSSPNPLTGQVLKDNDTLKLICDDCPASGTFDNIAQYIFSGSCSFSGCHIGPTPPAGLNLEAASAHSHLVGVTPNNAMAAAEGMKLVDPGNPANSFILDKLCGPDPGNPELRPAVCAGHDLVLGSSNEGEAMPPPTGGLSEAKIQLIYDWIAAGAPATGWVSGTHCGVPPDLFEPIPQPPVPAGGFQIELPPYDLAPGQEIEGCMWMRLPITEPMDVGTFEVRMNENSHHFILFRYVDNGQGTTPPLNVWNPNDKACLSGGFFSENLTGAQDPIAIDAYPDGLARTLNPGDIVGLNSHYINSLNVPIQGHVYVNFYPYTGTQPHKTAKTLFATDANFSNTGIGLTGPGIAPFTSGLTQGNWVNPEQPGVCIVGLTSHMHKRGVLFTEEYPVGTQIYANTDWDHPFPLRFDPPLWVPYLDTIHYECTHDNGESNPNAVKRDGTGVPTKLYFGFSADDEMCIMPGIYFVPATAGACALP